jgi:hypothetical protein
MNAIDPPLAEFVPDCLGVLGAETCEGQPRLTREGDALTARKAAEDATEMLVGERARPNSRSG